MQHLVKPVVSLSPLQSLVHRLQQKVHQLNPLGLLRSLQKVALLPPLERLPVQLEAYLVRNLLRTLLARRVLVP
jgi:hypothetical protein